MQGIFHLNTPRHESDIDKRFAFFARHRRSVRIAKPTVANRDVNRMPLSMVNRFCTPAIFRP